MVFETQSEKKYNVLFAFTGFFQNAVVCIIDDMNDFKPRKTSCLLFRGFSALQMLTFCLSSGDRIMKTRLALLISRGFSFLGPLGEIMNIGEFNILGPKNIVGTYPPFSARSF